MNNDQHNNQNNPTYNTPVIVELLPTAVTNKNMTKDRTFSDEFYDNYTGTR